MLKRCAFEDSSLEEMEREIESDLEDRGLNNSENNFGRQSANSELLCSVKSSQDYWQVIENKLTKRQNRDRTKQATLEKKNDEQKPLVAKR